MDYFPKTNSSSLKYNNFVKSNPTNFNYAQTQNQFGKTFTHTESEFISKALSEREAIIISNNLIPNEDWQSIANHLINSQNIQTVELSGINITGYGLRTLADALQRSNTVKNLKLEWNYLNEYTEDFDYFCDVISNVKSLIYVSNSV